VRVVKEQVIELTVRYYDDDNPAREGTAPSQWDWRPVGNQRHIAELAPSVAVTGQGPVVRADVTE
jgi:hypothetical protein